MTIAKSQLENEGGEKYWSWYGFAQREEWCACFVSWCADQAGLIQSGAVPKFSLYSVGVEWFQSKGKWQATIDGNSGDAVKQNTHSVNATSIMGYGIVSG